MKKNFGIGLLVGFLLASPLVSLLYLGHVAAKMSFIPFDFFDGLTRFLPGRLVTWGIDSMVRLLMLLGLSLSASSKTAEQIQAVLIFIGTCSVLSGIFFAIRNNRRPTRFWPGLVLGLVAALPVFMIQRLASSHAHWWLEIIWTTLALVVWGTCVDAVHSRLAVQQTQSAHAVRTGAVQPVDRRRFLIKLSGATAGITVVGAAVAAALRSSTSERAGQLRSVVKFPDRAGTFIPAPGTRPEYTPVAEHYRIDINLMPMKIDGNTWRLAVAGLVDRPLELSLSDLQNLGEPLHQFVTLACISNPIGGDLIGTTRWSGITVRKVLDAAGVKEQARFLKIIAADGFHETVSLDLINSDDRIMFTYAWDDRPLTVEHGFPLRIYIPDRYGMKQPKWIRRVELLENDEPGYWVVRGWDKVARMKATSVIDTVAIESAFQRDGRTFVPIGGIAHAGARGISRVEVRVDDGVWTPAVLRSPLSDLTWVLWRYDWPFQPGNHLFTVRCCDGAGSAQIETPSEPHPSGASGLFSISKRF